MVELLILDARGRFLHALDVASDPDSAPARRDAAQGQALVALAALSFARFAALASRLEKV